MKKSVKLVFLAVILIALLVTPLAATIKTGSRIPVIEWQWITVMNPEGINSANNYFKFGDEAGISENGYIKVMKLDGKRFLCKYVTSLKKGGTQCPNGTLFFLSKAEITRQIKSPRLIRLNREREHVKLLLRKIK